MINKDLAVVKHDGGKLHSDVSAHSELLSHTFALHCFWYSVCVYTHDSWHVKLHVLKKRNTINVFTNMQRPLISILISNKSKGVIFSFKVQSCFKS